MKKTILVSLLGFFLAVSLAHAQTDREEAGLTPNNFFYFLDQFNEWLDLKLTFDPIKKAEKKVLQAAERVAEISALEKEGGLEKKHAEKLKTDYEELSMDVEDDIDELKTQGKDVAELIRKMEELAAEHTAKLEAVLEKVPDEAKDAIEHALEVSQRGHERAIEALEKEIEEGNIDEEELEDEAKIKVRELKEKKTGVRIEELRLDDSQDDIGEMFLDLEETNSRSFENDLDSI